MDTTYTPVIGIEIHVELATKSKMFCGCTNDPFNAEKPNIYTCPVCLGMPGGLPVANKQAVEWTIKIGQALGCKIATFSKFDRKHYFYPDLAKGYQISQYDQPLCVEGLVTTELGDVRITRVHLEEDTGKLIHSEIPSNSVNHPVGESEASLRTGSSKNSGEAHSTALRYAQGNHETQRVSLIDFNRAGVPLVEIVTEPDIKSAAHAKAYAKKIAQIIRYLDVSTADMEKGSMRLEANISVQSAEEKAAGKLPDYKVEVKNLNSFRFIERAVTYEVKRQADIRSTGELPKQETRGWNENKNQTFSQRSKESAEDYRYFPDPDLPPLHFDDNYIDSIKKTLPVLPDELIKTWIEKGIKENEAGILADDKRNIQLVKTLFETASEKNNPLKTITQWINKKITLSDQDVETKDANSLAASLYSQSAALAQTVSISDDELERVVSEVLASNQKAAADYKAGKVQVMGFLMGMVKRQLGNIDIAVIKEKLESKLR